MNEDEGLKSDIEALNQEAEEINSRVESLPAEQTTEEVEEQETESEPTGDEEVEEPKTETEGKERKGASQRIRELNEQKKAAELKAQSLEEKLAGLTGSLDRQGQMPYIPQQDEPLIKPGEEIDAVELEKRLKTREAQQLQRTQALIELNQRKSEALSKINTDSVEAIRAYPQLDPSSDDYDPELSETIYDAVEAHVQANPYKASVKSFVDKMMKPYTKAVNKEVGRERENIAKQVSQTALRPTSVRQAEKRVEDLSIEELEKKLGVYQS